jgi:hypothetical protein
MTLMHIAHRGNVNGPNKERENKVDYILEALNMGYDCEIDVWKLEESLFLGHDGPETPIEYSFLHNNKERFWIHCKNSTAFSDLISKGFHCFFHDKDTYTLTSRCYIWGNIDSDIIPHMICVMPEKYKDWNANITVNTIKESGCIGVCSDYISLFDV